MKYFLHEYIICVYNIFGLALSSFTISQHFNSTDYKLQTNEHRTKYHSFRWQQIKPSSNHSSPFSSGVIFSKSLLESCTSSSSQIKAVGGRSSPFPNTNLSKGNSYFSSHPIKSYFSYRPRKQLASSPQSTILKVCLQQDQRLQFLLDPGGTPGLQVLIFLDPDKHFAFVPVLGTIEISWGWKRTDNFSPAWLCKRCQESPVAKGFAYSSQRVKIRGRLFFL